jgi:ribosomal-protein-alanine N-acetyltransferase
MELTSRRLSYHRIERKDLEAVHGIFGDPALTRYFASGPDRTIGDSENRIARIGEHWQRYGFGDFLVRDQSTGDVVGFCGLHHKVSGGEVNLSYVIQTSHQGQGLGREVALRMIEHGIVDLGLERIVAEIDPENTPSKGLASSCGFYYDHRVLWEGKAREVWVLGSDNLGIPVNGR